MKLIIVISFILLLITVYLLKNKMSIIVTSLSTFILGVFFYWYISSDFPYANDIDIYRVIVPLGALIVTTASLVLTAQTAKNNSLANQETRTENTLMNMIKLNNDIIKEIDNEMFSLVLYEIKEEFYKYTFMLSRGSRFIRTYFSENQVYLLELIDSVDISKFPAKDQNRLTEYRNVYRELLNKKSRRNLNKFWFTLNETTLDYKVELSDHNKKNIYKDPFTKVLMQETSFYNEIKHAYRYYNRVLTAPVDYEEMCIACNNILNKYYGTLGHLFRNTHRIIKLINNAVEKDGERKAQYIGILRAQLSEEILLVLFYNAAYTDRGLGLGRELLGSGFFGQLNDFPYYINTNDPLVKKNYKEPQHFRLGSLILPAMDCELMSTFFSNDEVKISKKMRNNLSNEELVEEFKKAFTDNQSNNFKKSISKRREHKGITKPDEA